MGLFSKDIRSMDDLFVHGLQDIYYAENQILKSLPNMIDKAASGELKKGLQTHLGETRKQVQRLEQVFRMHGQEVQGASCPAIDGILEEADDIMGEVEDQNVLDAAMIALAEEKATDKKLTVMAKKRVNPAAERRTRTAAGRVRKGSSSAAHTGRTKPRRTAKKPRPRDRRKK